MRKLRLYNECIHGPGSKLQSVSPYFRPHRMIAARLGCCILPHFLIIGTQRGGTTSLYNYLVQHPRVKGALRKEVHYFDFNYSKGLTWYLAHFPVGIHGNTFLTGESSPYYLFHPDVPKRVAETLPNAKFLVLLRNPVDRAYSQYHHEVKLGYETLSFEKAINREYALMESQSWGSPTPDMAYAHNHYSYLSRGIYVDQLKRWMQTIPRERFLILKSEEFYSNPGRVFFQVLDFLRLPRAGPTSFPIHNEGKYSDLSEVTRSRLNSFFLPHNQRLSSFLGNHFEEWV